MTAKAVRVLLVADTHLGFDLPFRPRIVRRRRGRDFFANFERALQPALQGKVDLVVHGGDLFYRSKVPAALVEMGLAPLIKVANRGTPVYIVPGNHERSRIPLHLWAAHPRIHIFAEPKTFVCSVADTSVALAGFPFSRGVRDVFSELVGRTRYGQVAADIRLLCIHQTVEGAQVGPSDYTFRGGPDVVRGRDIPGGFTAVLAGHIHRSQVLTHNLSGVPLAAPVVYPGAIERTSFAERDEDKHYVVLEFDLSDRRRGQLAEVSFVPLPARPMVTVVVELDGHTPETLTDHLSRQLSALDPEAVVRVQLRGSAAWETHEILSAAHLRALAPPTMNVSLAYHRMQAGSNRGSRDHKR